MRLAVVEIVPLIGEQDAVRLALAQFIRQPPADMLIVVRIGVGQRRHFDQLGAAEPKHVFLFLALRFRNHDQRAIAARVGDEREPDAGVAGGGLDHEPARLELAALFRLEDHLPRRPILHRLARIHELGFAEDGASGRLRRAHELDQRRIADGGNDAVVDLHVFRAVRRFARTNLEEGAGRNKPTPRLSCGWSRRGYALVFRARKNPSDADRESMAAPANSPSLSNKISVLMEKSGRATAAVSLVAAEARCQWSNARNPATQFAAWAREPCPLSTKAGALAPPLPGRQ